MDPKEIMEQAKPISRKFLSRKLLVWLVSSGSVIAVGFGAPVEAVATLVPSLAFLALMYLGAQGWIDKAEVDARAGSNEIEAAILAGVEKADDEADDE